MDSILLDQTCNGGYYTDIFYFVGIVVAGALNDEFISQFIHGTLLSLAIYDIFTPGVVLMVVWAYSVWSIWFLF